MRDPTIDAGPIQQTEPAVRHKQAQKSDRGAVVVTGASGFIGSHVCNRLASGSRSACSLWGFDRDAKGPGVEIPFVQGELSRPQDLEPLRRSGARHVVHLAAESRVVFPFSEMSLVIDSNVSGTLNVLQVLDPDLLVFASSSAVYGHALGEAVSSDWSHVNPVGVYGMSKAMGELICAEWARSAGRSAVALRFGNVIGPRCHGLIPYLVEHAKRYPRGEVPAECRGGGRIVRDYLPVDYVMSVLERALELSWPKGRLHALNLGTGRGMTNRDVAEVVRSELEAHGLRLVINWDNPSPESEASAVILDTGDVERLFDIPTPGPEEIRAAIVAATRHCLGG